MKNKLLIILLLLIASVSSIISVILIDYNQKLEDVVNSKNELLQKISSQDSALIEATKEYSNTISKYTYETEFSINNKKISAKELVSLFNNLLEENLKLRDSLYNYKIQILSEAKISEHYKKNYLIYFDSTSYFKVILQSAMKDYGIQYNVRRIDSAFVLRRVFTKADSALIIFPYYKNRLRKDPTTDNWIITYEEKVPVINKQKK